MNNPRFNRVRHLAIETQTALQTPRGTVVPPTCRSSIRPFIAGTVITTAT